MTDLVSRNTLQLAGTASNVDGAYAGYTIVLTRFNNITGKELIQDKPIIRYDGASRIATIDGIWDPEFIPDANDSYKIVPNYPDSRVSINPAMQTLDYITSDRYGRNLDPYKDLYLPSWLESGRDCDAQSDVTIEAISNLAGIDIGDIYTYNSSGILHWQGEVKSINPPYITFTNNLGKLTNKWNSWKAFNGGALVYNEDVLYRVDGSTPVIITTQPTHTTGDANSLHALNYNNLQPYIGKVSGTGPSGTIQMAADGNPIRSKNTDGFIISGYSLYDSDGIDYWRYAGWDVQDQRSVTRHQTNLVVDTSQPLFDNINGLLAHFNGILRYTAGKYYLEVEAGEGDIPNESEEPRNITSDQVIGKIRITDEGVKSSYNSLTVAYADPSNKYEAKNISFFNSDFLKTDRNVPKKGNLSIPGVTNYYNARLMADKYLIKSRYGLTISLTLTPQGELLLAGKVIQLQNERYGWINKKFRIVNITHNPDATVDIVAEEYDDKFYVISHISRPPAAALAAENHTKTNIMPGSLVATNISSQDEEIGGIELNWANSPQANTGSVTTELFGSSNAHLFITISSINTNVLISTTNHGLSIGDVVTSQTAVHGLQFGKSYFVKTIPSINSFTLSETPNGTTINYLSNGTALALKILTASIIATIDPPTTSYIDVIPGSSGSDRIQKYYWIRHKITKT